MSDPRAGLLSRRQIAEILQQRFYVTQQADSLRTIFSRLGIKWLAMGTDPESGRGQVSFYDPLVVWVMATYFHWPRLAGASPNEGLRSCVATAREMLDDVDDAKTRRLAYYLFIADPRWGLDPRVLDSALASDPALLDLTLDGPDVLKSVLVQYKAGVLTGLMGQPVENVRLASDYDRQFIEGFGDVGLHEWPFFGANTSDLMKTLADAGLYDPSQDRLTKDMQMSPEVIEKLGIATNE